MLAQALSTRPKTHNQREARGDRTEPRGSQDNDAPSNAATCRACARRLNLRHRSRRGHERQFVMEVIGEGLAECGAATRSHRCGAAAVARRAGRVESDQRRAENYHCRSCGSLVTAPSICLRCHRAAVRTDALPSNFSTRESYRERVTHLPRKAAQKSAMRLSRRPVLGTGRGI